MPVLTGNESVVCDSSEAFIHVRNLPWSASRSDIKEYFKEYSIKEGGILLRGKEAFVAFKHPLDLASALCRKQPSLQGCCIQLSAISKDGLQEELMRCTRRKLNFEKPDQNFAMTIPRPEKRKIRPTPIESGQKRRALSNSVFSSQEVNLPPPQYNKIKTNISRKRKVHPTKVSADVRVENFAVFHPEKCYEFPNIRFGMHATCVIGT